MIAAPIGVWFPNIVMVVFAVLVYQKDRLPASNLHWTQGISNS